MEKIILVSQSPKPAILIPVSIGGKAKEKE